MVFRLGKQIHKDLKRKFRVKADFIMGVGMLMFMYGRASPSLYETSGVSLKLPGLEVDTKLTDWQFAGADSTSRKITYEMKAYFGDDFSLAMELLPLVRKVFMGSDVRLACTPASVTAFIKKHGIDFEEDR
jgi:hypothetical protein